MRAYHPPLLGACIAAAALTLSTHAAGVETETPPPRPPQGMIDEIVVTASKREEQIGDLSSAVTALSGATLEQRALTSTQDIALSVPNMVYGENLGSAYLTIRGIGLNINTGVAEQGVATHIDGVYIAPAVSANLVNFDVERVEVLRGPQGTLYGRNATGGAVNYVGRKPTQDAQAGYTFGLGRDDRFLTSGYVSGPVTDQLSGRVALRKERMDGHGYNLTTGDDYGGADKLSGKAMLRYAALDDLQFDLGFYYTNETIDGPVAENITPFREGSPLASMGAQFTLEPHDSFNDFASFQRNLMAIYTGRVTWDTEHFTLTSITGHVNASRQQRNDLDSSDLPVLVSGALPVDSKSYSQEINLSGQTSRLKWIGGLYTFREEMTASNQVLTGAGAEAAFIERRVDTTSYSAFVDLTWSLTERLRTITGARYNHDEKKARCFRRQGGNVLTGEPRESWSRLLPRVGLEFDAGDDTLTYVQFQEGFKSGGLNLGASGCGMFEPERIYATEIGVKTRLFDNRLSLHGAAFHYDYRDLQQTIVNVDSASLSTDIRNAAKVDVIGIELEASAWLAHNLRADLAVGWLDAQYDEYRLIDQINPGLGEQDLAGNEVVMAPEFTAMLGIEVDFPLIGRQATLRGEVFHSSSYQVRAFNYRDEIQSSYEIVNAYLTVELAPRYTLRGFVRNLTDTAHVLSVYEVGLSNSLNGFYNRPRTWGIELSAAF